MYTTLTVMLSDAPNRYGLHNLRYDEYLMNQFF